VTLDKSYSYTSSKIYSFNRWACVGESSIFSDPFYSPGSDIIAINNTLTAGMIKADLAGNLTKENVDLLNTAMLDIVYPDQISYTRESYHTFGNTQVASAKFYWDTTYYWSLFAHPFLNGHFSDIGFVEEYVETIIKFSRLNRKVQQLFKLWANKTTSKATFEFCDLARKYVFVNSAIELLTEPGRKEFVDFAQNKHERFEKMANALYIYANRQFDLNPNELGSEYDQDLVKLDNPLTKYTEKELSKEMNMFKEFFEPLSLSERIKIRYMQFVANIDKGAFLYSVRGFYIRNFVHKRKRIQLQGMLRLIFAD
ncbi:MAG: hypothetical protein QF371_08900, partial [Flavobacteriales bacterium]|nr:hypothetical protein [Flavobacteriales bacterium]